MKDNLKTVSSLFASDVPDCVYPGTKRPPPVPFTRAMQMACYESHNRGTR